MCDLLSKLIKDQREVTELKHFKAIVLIDEIDLFLHPRWAYSLMSRLRELFPEIQWFISTHSPVITLGASSDAVFYKLYKNEKGKTEVSEPLNYNEISDLMSNGILTSPLFDMEYAGMIEHFKNENIDIDTSDSYLDSRISKFIKQKLYEKRQKTKTNLTFSEIDNLILLALDKNEGGEL